MTIDFPTLIPKFDAILARGLCQGVGTRDGQMCIEAAICAALDLPHGDEPSCVEPAVRAYKIRLNDARWSSPQARAAGLRAVGIAQIGSAGVVDGNEFTRRLAERTIRVLIPRLFRDVFPANPACLRAADRCETEGTKESARAAARSATYAARSATSTAADAADYADATSTAAANAAAYADATSTAADAAAAANAAAAAAAYAAANAANDADDAYLRLSADLALEVLRDLKSPGCAYV